MVSCPACGSDKTSKIGFRIVMKPQLHKKQRFQCQKCGKTFYEQPSVSITGIKNIINVFSEKFTYESIKQIVTTKYGNDGIGTLNFVLKKMRTSGKLKLIPKQPRTYKKVA